VTTPTAIAPPIEHRYRPRGTARAILKCRDPEVLLSGPAGTGKSRACLEKLHAMCLLNPGMRGLICRKAATSLSSTALVTWNRFVAAEAVAAGDLVYFGGSGQEPASYRYKNGSVIVIGGLDKVSKIMSAEYDVIYVQEATELALNDWEALTTRLRNWRVSFQQLLADCNPQNPDHWLKQRCDVGKTALFESIHEDNPVLFTSEGEITEKGSAYIAKLDALTGVRYQRLRLGKWVAAEGVIYEDYKSSVHIVDRGSLYSHTQTMDHVGIPMSWPRYWSVDFGYTHPFVLQCWAEDPDGRMYLYREIFHTRRTVDQHCAQLKSMIIAPDGRWLEPRPHTISCDHDAEGRAVLERELQMGTEPAHKSVLEGIEAVQVRMRMAGDGRPRIFLVRDALVEKDPLLDEANRPTCTIEEIPGYCWRNKSMHKNELDEQDEPLKEMDDGCDALRYAIAERDFGVRAIFRSFSA
jgi:phage terminase large subunit